MSASAHNSSRRCQSVELCARRETSRPSTNARAPETHLGDETLEVHTISRTRARLAEVTVDHDDPFYSGDRQIEIGGGQRSVHVTGMDRVRCSRLRYITRLLLQ